MALSPDQVDAFDALQVAIDRVDELSGEREPGEFTTGWVVVTCGATFSSDDEPGDDEHDTEDHLRAHVKRGQSPVLTRGIVECYLDRFRSPERDE